MESSSNKIIFTPFLLLILTIYNANHLDGGKHTNLSNLKTKDMTYINNK
jgi:hypothetical protein